MNIIFVISTSNNPIINKIYAWERWRTSAWYLPFSKIVVNERSNASALNVLWTKISTGGSVKNSWPDVFVGQSVSQSVCVSKHFREWRPNGWSNRARRGTIRRAKTPERRWCLPWVDWWHMAHGTCRRVKACNNFRTALQVKRWGPLISNLNVTRRLP